MHGTCWNLSIWSVVLIGEGLHSIYFGTATTRDACIFLVLRFPRCMHKCCFSSRRIRENLMSPAHRLQYNSNQSYALRFVSANHPQSSTSKEHVSSTGPIIYLPGLSSTQGLYYNLSSASIVVNMPEGLNWCFSRTIETQSLLQYKTHQSYAVLRFSARNSLRSARNVL